MILEDGEKDPEVLEQYRDFMDELRDAEELCRILNRKGQSGEHRLQSGRNRYCWTRRKTHRYQAGGKGISNRIIEVYAALQRDHCPTHFLAGDPLYVQGP